VHNTFSRSTVDDVEAALNFVGVFGVERKEGEEE
jgi:hypothetical protein